MKRVLVIGVIVLPLLMWAGMAAHQKMHAAPVAAASAPQWVQAQRKEQSLAFYFKGTLYPIRTQPVLSPFEGVIQQVLFRYGAAVPQGAPLLTIQPTKLMETFRTLLASYLQKKAVYEAQQTKFAGDQALYKAGVIAKQDFVSAKDSFATSALEFHQAKLELEKVLPPLQLSARDIEGLHLSDTAAVTRLLARESRAVTVVAPSAGVVLIPLKTAAEAGAATTQTQTALQPGALVKEQEPILSLGDLSGYAVDVEVSELDVTRLSPGLPAVVTGEAFPGVELQGEVVQVAAQADPNQATGGNVSVYRVLVQIPTVPTAVQPLLRVGMTAKVEIRLTTVPQVTVPIAAVFIRQGKTWVTQRDAEGGVAHDQVVQTGATTSDEVAILSGLTPGAWVRVAGSTG